MFSLAHHYLKYDPAAKSLIEILLLYPGPRAIFFHRVAHYLALHNVPLLPRLISEISRFLTGIDIHPGAQIGRNLIIDHGMGLVIGETTIVGNNVTLFHGVTLGGTRFHKGKRHPTLEDGVVVGAGAKILGDIRIGQGTRIGANSVVVSDIPPYSTAIGIPAKVLKDPSSYGEFAIDYTI